MAKKTPKRIELNTEILDQFFRDIYQGDVATAATESGLSYGTIYNLVHGRIRSLSAVDYRRIFGEMPPEQKPKRVSGNYFRGMARLWLFLNDQESEKTLFEELHRGIRSPKRPDCRIFTGQTRTVDRRLEEQMEQKFLDQGLDRTEIRVWIQAMDREPDKPRIPYMQIRPALQFLQKTLNVHPTGLLNQSWTRYESGELKTVAWEIYRRIRDLKTQVESVLASGSRDALEAIRERIYPGREGYVPYREVADQIEFLEKFGNKGIKSYLGRSASHYRAAELKRISMERADRIRVDCDQLIQAQKDVSLAALPQFHRRRWLWRLVSTLRSCSGTMLLNGAEHEETAMLSHGLQAPGGLSNAVRMDQASAYLQMSARAFDLLVVRHRDIFRQAGKYDQNWYLPKWYLSHIKQHPGFPALKAKYELLARSRSARARALGMKQH